MLIQHGLNAGQCRIVTNASCSSAEAEKCYYHLEKEGLASAFRIERFRSYIYCSQFTLLPTINRWNICLSKCALYWVCPYKVGVWAYSPIIYLFFKEGHAPYFRSLILTSCTEILYTKVQFSQSFCPVHCAKHFTKCNWCFLSWLNAPLKLPNLLLETGYRYCIITTNHPFCRVLLFKSLKEHLVITDKYHWKFRHDQCWEKFIFSGLSS